MEKVVATGALKDRFARLSGELIALQKPAAWRVRFKADRAQWEQQTPERAERIRRIEEEIAGLAAVIPQFDPAWQPKDTKPIRPMERRRELPHGAFTRAVFDALRNAKKPMTSQELAQTVCLNHHLAYRTLRQRENTRDLVHKALARLAQYVAHDESEPRQWWVIDGRADPDFN